MSFLPRKVTFTVFWVLFFIRCFNIFILLSWHSGSHTLTLWHISLLSGPSWRLRKTQHWQCTENSQLLPFTASLFINLRLKWRTENLYLAELIHFSNLRPTFASPDQKQVWEQTTVSRHDWGTTEQLQQKHWCSLPQWENTRTALQLRGFQHTAFYFFNAPKLSVPVLLPPLLLCLVRSVLAVFQGAAVHLQLLMHWWGTWLSEHWRTLQAQVFYQVQNLLLHFKARSGYCHRSVGTSHPF